MAELPELSDGANGEKPPRTIKAGNGVSVDSAQALSRRTNQTLSVPAGAPLPVYKALSDFSVMFDGISLQFKMGEMIAQPSLIQTLLAQKCPIGTADDAVRHRCPKCGTVSAIQVKSVE